MRVLITGAGLIGTHTAKALAERGNEVAFFDFAPRPEYIRHVIGQEPSVIRGDIRDLAALHSDGILSDEEFAAAKANLLSQM